MSEARPPCVDKRGRASTRFETVPRCDNGSQRHATGPDALCANLDALAVKLGSDPGALFCGGRF